MVIWKPPSFHFDEDDTKIKNDFSNHNSSKYIVVFFVVIILIILTIAFLTNFSLYLSQSLERI